MMRNLKSYAVFESEFIKTGPNTWQMKPDNDIHNVIAAVDVERKARNKAHPGWWHGTPDMSLIGKNGIHVGTYEAAKEALEARIGVPAEGDWDGTKEYGKTLLAGKKRLKELGPFLSTGFNCGADVPDENYYPGDRKERANYSDRSLIPFDVKPTMLHVDIIGRMSNTISNPHTDQQANGIMRRSLNSGKAKSGFYYNNDGEDSGSISAVVPDKTFLKILN